MERNKFLFFTSSLVVVFLGGLILRLAKPVLFPFFLAVFFYFILSPALDFLTRLKIPKAISIIFILLVTFSVLYLLGFFFYNSGKSFASDLPKYGQKLTSIVETIQNKFKVGGARWNLLAWVENLNMEKVGTFFLSTLGPFFSFISNLFLILIFLIFMLAGKGKVNMKVESSFDKERASKILTIFQNINGQIQKYLVIKTVISLITGILATMVLLIFGVEFAIVFGFLTFILNYIPNIGSIIATAFPALIAAFQFESLWPAFWIVILLIMIQMTLGNIVEPKLMGQGLGLSPLFVLFSLFFWGWLWGIAGMVLAVPITAIIKIICGNFPSLKIVEALMSK